MTTVAPKFFCPRCRAAFEVDSKFCGQCGANMHRASRLARAEVEARADDGADAPRDRRLADARDPWLGRVIDGRYRVVEAIGRGGMGVVYKVEHQRMGKIAAMKVLHRDLASDREVVQRFRREAEAVSRLTHPNSVQVFDFGEADGALYLVMEYVRGRDLGSLVDRDGPLPLSRAAPLFFQIADALAEAHELGVIHRDLKPENVLVTRTHGGQDFVKVLDFGLAKLTEREDPIDADTHSGYIVGTPYYMSPEQIRGESVDARTDIYSLAALIYRVLTGEHAYDASTPVGVLTKHITEPFVPPSERRPDLGIPAAVDAALARAMEKSPARRHESVGDLVAELAAAAREGEGHAARVRPRTPSDPVCDGIDSELRLRRSDVDVFERTLRRRRWTRRAVVPLALAGAIAAGVPAALRYGEGPRTEEAEPNDRIESATAIALETEVRGFIGKRASRSESDHDFYRIVPPLEANERARVEVRVTGLPNMALRVAVYERSGTILAHTDAGGVGEDQTLTREVTGPFFILVTEARTPGELPTENVSDAYELTVATSATSAAEPPPGRDT